MTSSNRGSQRSQDRISPETHHALLAALTVIKAQAQMVERWVHHGGTPDAEVVLRRLEMIDQVVTRMVLTLDAMPRARAARNDPDGSADGSGRA